MSGPCTITAALPDACAIVSGFYLQNEAMSSGENGLADQVNEALADIFEEIKGESVVDLGAAFSLIILDLVNRLARLSSEPRDDLWQAVITDLNTRFNRQNGENDE